jgi:hypothetical protein
MLTHEEAMHRVFAARRLLWEVGAFSILALAIGGALGWLEVFGGQGMALARWVANGAGAMGGVVWAALLGARWRAQRVLERADL